MKVLADLERGEARLSIDMQVLTDLKSAQPSALTKRAYDTATTPL